MARTLLPSLFAIVFSIALSIVFAVGCASSSPPQSNEPPIFPADPLTTVAGTQSATTIEVRTAPTQPPTRGVVDVELRVHDHDGKPVDGLVLQVVPWMNAHGHGASTTPTIVDEGSGRYRVRGVDLFMPGEWSLPVDLSGAVHDRIDATVEVK